jgi:hypothetical protein
MQLAKAMQKLLEYPPGKMQFIAPAFGALEVHMLMGWNDGVNAFSFHCQKNKGLGKTTANMPAVPIWVALPLAWIMHRAIPHFVIEKQPVFGYLYTAL